MPAAGAPHRRRAVLRAKAALAVVLGLCSPVLAQEPLRLRIVGGIDGLNQFTALEAPFWTETLPLLTKGRVVATIHAFDRSGLRGQDLLQLMRLGVVPFGTVILTMAAMDEPEISALDLPALNPDIAALRRSIAAYRPRLATLLRERYGIELLGIYAYPAQVVFCTAPFAGFGDLAGRRIRTSSVSQSEMVAGLGATPVLTSFNEIVPAVAKKVVDCAITGTLSGHEIGLSGVTTHVHTVAVNWGVSIFAANAKAWEAIPADLRAVIREGISGLEAKVLDAAGHDTGVGLRCSTGAAPCAAGPPGRMTRVDARPEDEAIRRRILVDTVLPKWLDRCGPECAAAWNSTLAATSGIRIDDAAAGAAKTPRP